MMRGATKMSSMMTRVIGRKSSSNKSKHPKRTWLGWLIELSQVRNI